MSWQDSWALMARTYAAPTYKPPKNSLAQTWQQATGQRRTFGTAVSRPRGVNWSDLASGRLASTRAVAPPPQEPSPLEKFQVSLPYSSSGPRSPYAPPPPEAPRSTEGDLVGSIAGAAGSVVANLNLANVIPWFMERVNVLSHDLADAQVPGAAVAATATDTFIDGVDAIAQPIGQLIDGFPSFVRDSTLADRAKLYRGILTNSNPDYGLGPLSNPLQTVNEINPLAIPFRIVGGILGATGLGDADMREFLQRGGLVTAPGEAMLGISNSEAAARAARYEAEILHAIDPAGRMAAEQRLATLRETIDIPESVKRQLERNPGADDAMLAKWLDEAPEGRAWSYDPGPAGVLQNIATPLAFYLAEARTGGQVLGAVKGAGLASEVPGIARGTALATKGASATLRLMTAATAAGVGITSVTTAMNAVARYQGNEAAIRWFDNANRTTPFSDDPMVQLVTGFAINPFKVVGNAKTGVVTLKHGLVDVPLDLVTGNRLNRLYNSTDITEGMIARMFKLGSADEAAAFLDETGLRDQAPDMVMATALDTVLDRLPAAERTAINAMHADPAERAAFVLKRYGQQALDLIDKDPRLVAARFHEYDWQYRMMPGAFEPYVAARIALDYRRAMNRSYDLRIEQNGVVGYREYLPPQGQTLARAELDRITTADGMVPVRGVDGLQSIVADFPALRKHWGGVEMGSGTITRAQADRILDLAAADYANAAKLNPRRVATGMDPILRPDSPTPTRDIAEAMGTSVDTIEAITQADLQNTAKVELLRKFLVDKADLDPTVAAGLTPEDAFARAFALFDDTTTPWFEMGKRVMAADKQLGVLEGELARVTARRADRTTHDVQVRLRAQINELKALLRTAGDPVEPFAAQSRPTVTSAALRNSTLAEAAARKVDAMDRLRVVESVDAQLAEAGLDVSTLDLVVTGADGKLALAHELIPAPPKTILDAYLAYRTASMQSLQRTTTGFGPKNAKTLQLSKAGQELIADTEAAPGSYQWAQIMSSPGFVKRLREIGDEPAFDYSGHGMTGNQMADAIEATGLSRGIHGEGIDEIAARMGVTREEALARLAGMKRAREQALDGKGPAALKRTAGIKVPDDYVAQAAADKAARELTYDAEYEAFWHPRNVAKVQEIAGSPDELWPALRGVAEADPAIAEGIAAVAQRAGRTADDVLDDLSFAAAVRAEVVPAGFEAPIEGMIREATELDFLIRAGDESGIAALAEQVAAQARQQRPPIPTPERVAQRLAAIPKRRMSYQFRRALFDAGGDMKAAPSASLMARAENQVGLEVLSVLNHGVIGTKPATLDGLLNLLHVIENGDAGRVGIGVEMQAEAQRVARLLLEDGLRSAKRAPENVGILSGGFFAEDEAALVRTLDTMLTFDDADPLGTLQYGIKKAPKDAVVMEWSKIPGLAEEMLSRRFLPYEQRVAVARVREAYNYVFGPHSNASARLEVRNRFTERLGRKGLTPETAKAIWERWSKISHDSRSPSLRKRITGKRRYESGDNPLYADVWNIPNERLDATVHGSSAQPGVLDDLLSQGKITAAEYDAAGTIDFAHEFRESASTVRRVLADKVPLGKALADAYGMVAHNKTATTLYYWFRFGLDVRYHAMNYLEAQILYMGRAGLRKGEIDEGLLGQTEGYLRNLDADPTSNTGYVFSRDRMAWAYRTFLKEQPDALRKGLKGLASEDPAVMGRALRELAESDPQLRDMIREFDGLTAAEFGAKVDPTVYLKEMDDWYRKMLANVDEVEDAKVIDDLLAAQMKDTPELAQVYDRLGQVNKDLWDDIRATFYGNPNRSRAERFLNSYLLFWPLSYQIKSTKWFMRVLFDRAGGIQTNALGAVTLDRVADTHNRLLATDPEYRDWFEKHDTLVFTAQMLFPVSFDSMGVSLNPALRSMFFDRTKAAMEIGPVYTFNRVIKPLADELYVDVYPTLGDFPPLDGLYRLTAGREPPKPPSP